MVKLNLKADTAELEVLKSYLEENASPTLVEKIENGVKITKDGKTLVNKKDLAGFMKYACEEARKLAGKGATGACVKDEIVFGWLIHYFEEESIEGKLYNEDGTPNAMNAAWGGQWDAKEIMICMGTHATTENLERCADFTVAFATRETLIASDFVGIVSAKNDPQKMQKTASRRLRR